MMILEIETSALAVLFDLLNHVEAGANTRIPGGAEITVPELPRVRSGHGEPIRLFVNLSCGLSVDARVTGSWLYEKLKGKAQKLWINKAELRIDRSAITKAITANKTR